MTTAAWNVLLYAIAGDHEEHKRVTDAITDMHDALTTNQCNVVVQLHSKSKTTRHWISKGRKVQTETLPVFVDASEPASLTSFMNAANRTLPARSSALILWAHSSGLDHVHDYPKKAARPPGLDSVFGGRDEPGLGGGVGIEAVFGSEPANDYQPMFSQGSLDHNGLGRRRERYGCRWGPDPNTQQFSPTSG